MPLKLSWFPILQVTPSRRMQKNSVNWKQRRIEEFDTTRSSIAFDSQDKQVYQVSELSVKELYVYKLLRLN